MRKLHIGGKQPKAGWEILNAVAGPIVDHVGNARDLSRFPAETFEAVYASHVAEHFGYQNDLLSALREWHRVLVPSGTLYVSVPDLDVLAELMLLRESLDKMDRFQVMRMMFGGQTDPYDFHFVGLNFEFLEDFLASVGFEQITRVPAFGLFEDTSTFEFKGVPISLNLTARKPS